MATYINGTIVSVTQDTPSKDGSCYFQEVLMQHEWNNNPDFNKYITFSVISTAGNKRISGFHLTPGDEVEVALDINAKASESGRYFNSVTCFGVERDKKKWHRYERPERKAVAPAAFAQPAQPQYAAPATAPAAPATVPAASAAVYQAPSAPVAPAPAPAADNEDLPF